MAKSALTRRYAETTRVQSDKSRVEIERTLRRYDAEAFMYGWESLHNEYKEMMRRRDLWTDEMREIHARRKEAVDDCLLALADLDDVERSIVKDRLRDLFDLEDGLLRPSDVTPW